MRVHGVDDPDHGQKYTQMVNRYAVGCQSPFVG